MRLSKILTLALVLGAVFHAPQISAVFYYAQKYEHPETGNQIVVFRDLHIDIDSQVITRIQQRDVLREAKKRDALIIAEDPAAVSNEGRFYVLEGAMIALTVAACTGIASFGRSHLNIKHLAISNTRLIAMFYGGMYLYEQCKQWRTLKNLPSLSKYIAEVNKKYDSTKLLKIGQASPLLDLVQQAKRQRIKALSIEFRNKGAAELEQKNGLGWLFISKLWQADNWGMRKLTGNRKRYPITVKDYYQNQNKILKEIMSYNDGSTLKDFYNQCIAAYRADKPYIIEELRMLAKNDPNHSLATVVSNLAKKLGKEQATVYRDLKVHDYNLLDARVAHKIYTNRDRKTIFVCVGGYHAENIGPVLEKMGYRIIGHCGNNCLATEDLQLNVRVILRRIKAKDLDYLALDIKKVFAA